MDEMREIVTVEQVEHIFAVLAIAAPLAGLAIGVGVGVLRRSVRVSAQLGLLIGLAGPANYGLWRMYNSLTDRMGLDSVKNLLVNLAIFVIIGALAGVALGWAATRRPDQARRDPGATTSPERSE